MKGRSSKGCHCLKSFDGSDSSPSSVRTVARLEYAYGEGGGGPISGGLTTLSSFQPIHSRLGSSILE